MEKYINAMGLTQQFRFCGNAFRVDTYRGCDFGCLYCFSNNKMAGYYANSAIADMDIIESRFEKAFDNEESTNNINIELLRHRVPLHLGGLSDPFQDREFTDRATYKLLELSNKYNYPMIISTKCCQLPDEYYKLLNPDIHAFQLSIIGHSDEFLNRFEANTGRFSDRLAFIKKLKSLGFWVAVRIQPLIDIEEAKLVIKNTEEYVDYFTVEHIKLPMNSTTTQKILELYGESLQLYIPKQGSSYQVRYHIKKKHVEELKKITKVKIGAGDNDLHELSDSKCCCGIDCINENFDNWLKYNYTYLATGGDEKVWLPQSSVRSTLFSSVRNSYDAEGEKLHTVKDYVDLYCKTFEFSIFKETNQLELF